MPDSTFKYSYKETLRENTGLSVYNSGLQKCEPGYNWGAAMRDHYLIHYVASGKGKYTVGKNGINSASTVTYDLSAGDMFLVLPDTIVSYTASLDDPWEYYWVGFHGADARRLLKLTDLSENSLVKRNCDTITLQLLSKIYDAHGSSPADDAAMTGRLYLFLSKLIDDSTATKSTASNEYFEKAVKFIGANLSSELSVCDVAQHCALSRSQLYRIFIQECAMSPIAFINNYKVSEACALLRLHKLTVSQAAYSVGFSDALYFSRVFKRVKGISPSRYMAL